MAKLINDLVQLVSFAARRSPTQLRLLTLAEDQAGLRAVSLLTLLLLRIAMLERVTPGAAQHAEAIGVGLEQLDEVEFEFH